MSDTMTQTPWWDDPQAPTPSLSEFLAEYEGDSNLWWRVGCGHHQNLFDMAMEEVERQEQITVLQAAVITDVVALLVHYPPGTRISRELLAATVKGHT